MNPPPITELSHADQALLDRLMAGGFDVHLPDTQDPDRAQRLQALLQLLKHWQAQDPETGLPQRTIANLYNTHPVSLCPDDARAADAVLALHAQGLDQGPMPAETKQREQAVRNILQLLNQLPEQPLPQGLAQRTLERIQQHRIHAQQRSELANQPFATHRQSSFGLRQLATTAALLLMSLSILLPVLSRAQRDAQIAQCAANLAGLGSDLQQIAYDNNEATYPSPATSPDLQNPLARFARSGLDGSTLPPAQASLFLLLDQQRITPQHLACPTASSTQDPALYNGQNPAAGGPFRVFLQPRPIFADTNPLYQLTPKGLVQNKLNPLATSPNHQNAGQNVLISDGSVRWLIRPAVQYQLNDDDNIWLYQPAKNPDSGDDIFLTP